MSVVFDEVTGSVEPARTSGAEAPPREEAPQGAAPAMSDEGRLDRWLRRRAWLEARRRAD